MNKQQVAIKSCVENGFRLLDDADFLGGATQTPTAFALYILAQEEFSKAFLLYLVEEKVLPWTPEVRRTLTDHRCKHLVGILIDFIEMNEEQWLEYHKAWGDAHRTGGPYPEGRHLTDKEVSAINLLRHEKVGKWKDRFRYLSDLEYEEESSSISRGKLDVMKQDCFYISISATSREVQSVPVVISEVEDEREKEKTKKFGQLANRLYDYGLQGHEFERVARLLTWIFSDSYSYIELPGSS